MKELTFILQSIIPTFVKIARFEMEKIVIPLSKNAKICETGYGIRQPDFEESDCLFVVPGIGGRPKSMAWNPVWIRAKKQKERPESLFPVLPIPHTTHYRVKTQERGVNPWKRTQEEGNPANTKKKTMGNKNGDHLISRRSAWEDLRKPR